MSETKTYTVTKQAGPRVAGRAVRPGDELELTEAQARGELASLAIVPGSKDGDAAKKVEETLTGSKKLGDIQARATGLDKAPPAEKPAAAEAGSEPDAKRKPDEEGAAAKKTIPPEDPKATGGQAAKPAAAV